MYLGDHPDRPSRAAAGGEALAPGGNLDHVGFGGARPAEPRAPTWRAGIQCRERIVPRDGSVQIFVVDPDGIKVELNFAVSSN